MSWLFISGGQSIGAQLQLQLDFPMNSQGWFPLGLIGLISFEKTLSLGKTEGRRKVTEGEMVGWHH